MPRIRIDKSLSCVAHWGAWIKEVHLAELPIGSGGFGEIYPVLSIEEQPVSDIVCKLFYPNPLSYKNFTSVQTLQNAYNNMSDIF